MDTSLAPLPATIGNYRIISKIGQGGMGQVFRAVQGTLDRPVALKLLPPEFTSNAEYVARFLREARVAAGLRHENIVQVYDAGEDNRRYYIAMEFIDGSNLLNYIEEKKQISEAEGLALLLQAAKGLAAAHAKDLVHRDIKPENLLLGKDGILRIVDFGLVREAASSTQLTATGACMGTPMYMSPEQADGHSDSRTDIYCLGASFFRVFTGQPPFFAPTALNIMYKHKFETPPVPKTLRADLSDDISNLLLTMMAKRREDRPQTAQALVELIEGIKQGKHIPPPPAVPAHPASPNNMPAVTRMPSGDTQATLIGNTSGAVAAQPPALPVQRPDRRKIILGAATAGGVLLLGLLIWLFSGPSKAEREAKEVEPIYAQMQKLVDDAVDGAMDAKDIDDKDDRTAAFNQKFRGFRSRFAKSARTYEQAKLDAKDLQTEISAAADYYDGKAEKQTSKHKVKVPFVTIGVGGESGSKFRSIAERFQHIEDNAKNLMRTLDKPAN